MERRDQAAPRVPYKTLVEVCGQEPGTPHFEAHSVELSGRGLHLRTEYVPAVGSPLVLRFADQGREVLAECEVAWATGPDDAAADDFGEFGVKFTALDPDSVRVLEEVCEEHRGAGGQSASKSGRSVRAASGAPHGRGSPVRLHMPGLREPMKAKVRTGTSQTLNVGQGIDFLQVGRHLEVETAGGRVGAEIDGVHVVVDPRTRVPQLVVTLRYDHPLEETPEPAIVDNHVSEKPAGEKTRTLPPVEARDGDQKLHVSARTSTPDTATGGSVEPQEPIALSVSALSKLGRTLSGSAQRAGSRAWVATKSTARGFGRGVRQASVQTKRRISETRVGRSRSKPRVTAPPPGAGAATGGRLASGLAGKRAQFPSSLKGKKVQTSLGLVGVVALLVVLSRFSIPDAAPASETPLVTVDGSTVVVDVPLFGPVSMKAEGPAFNQESHPWALVQKGKPWGSGKLQLPTTHKFPLSSAVKSLKVATEGSRLHLLLPTGSVGEDVSALTEAFRSETRLASVRTLPNTEHAHVELAFEKTLPAFRVSIRKGNVELRLSR